MTPEQVRELREAAKQHQSSRLRGYSVEAIVARDAHGDTMAKHILATTHADDHESATANWAAGIYKGDLWGDEFACRTRHDDNVTIARSNAVYVYRHCLGTMTRHQFRMLAGALGIQPKKEAV